MRKKSACVASPISRSPRESPCFPTKEPGIEMPLHVTLDSAWTLVNFAMEDSSERDSELAVFEIKR